MSLDIQLHPVYLNGVISSPLPPRNTKPTWPPSPQGAFRRIRALRPTGQTLRRQRACTSSSSRTEPECWIQPPRHPRTPPRLRSRRCGAGVPRRGPREGAGQPQAGPRGGDPLTERRRTRNLPTFAEAAERVVQQKRSGLAQSMAGPRLDGELSTLRFWTHRPDAGLGGDERRCHWRSSRPSGT